MAIRKSRLRLSGSAGALARLERAARKFSLGIGELCAFSAERARAPALPVVRSPSTQRTQ
jgi:hypothetical protein